MVWAGEFVSTVFDINMGVKQGRHASPHVFCLFLERVHNFITVHAPPSRHAYTPLLSLLVTFILLYTDDLVLIAYSTEQLQ